MFLKCAESSDLDGDGIGDNADTDRDGDGVANEMMSSLIMQPVERPRR